MSGQDGDCSGIQVVFGNSMVDQLHSVMSVKLYYQPAIDHGMMMQIAMLLMLSSSWVLPVTRQGMQPVTRQCMHTKSWYMQAHGGEQSWYMQAHGDKESWHMEVNSHGTCKHREVDSHGTWR